MKHWWLCDFCELEPASVFHLPSQQNPYWFSQCRPWLCVPPFDTAEPKKLCDKCFSKFDRERERVEALYDDLYIQAAEEGIVSSVLVAPNVLRDVTRIDRECAQGAVYIAYSADRSAYKIGSTQRSVLERLKHQRLTDGFQLALLTTTPRKLEFTIHAYLSQFRVKRTEYFQLTAVHFKWFAKLKTLDGKEIKVCRNALTADEAIDGIVLNPRPRLMMP